MAELPSMNPTEIETVHSIAQSSADGPVLMLNLNRYRLEARFPDGQLYRDYMSALDRLLCEVGGRVHWRTTVRGQVVGDQALDEAIAIWYPSHQAFLNLMSAPGSAENMRLRALAIEHADLHRCDADEVA
jgi:hypothetical protein